MEMAHLMEFVYLAETLSFKRTAEHFFVSRSVISRHLATLEDALGAQLVERSKHAVSLTAVGETFYRDAKILLGDYEVAMRHVRLAQQAKKRVVRIGYLRNATRPVIVRFVQDMKKRHPQLHLSLNCMEYGQLRRSLEEGSVDVALAVNVDPAVSRNYRSTPLYSDRFSAVMSRDNPLASRVEGVSLADLPEDKLLLPDSFVYSGLSDLIDGLVEAKSQIAAREYYRDLDMLYLKVQTEGFIALSSSLNNAMFGDKVAIIPLLDANSEFSVSAFYRDGLESAVLLACESSLKACRDDMQRWAAGKDGFSVAFNLGSFE